MVFLVLDLQTYKAHFIYKNDSLDSVIDSVNIKCIFVA